MPSAEGIINAQSVLTQGEIPEKGRKKIRAAELRVIDVRNKQFVRVIENSVEVNKKINIAKKSKICANLCKISKAPLGGPGGSIFMWSVSF